MQTEYKTYSTPMIIGQIADSSLNQIDSYAAEEDIPFGTAVMRGTDRQKQVLQSEGKEFLGIALRDDIQRDGCYPAKFMVSVMTKGRVAVIASEPVVAGDIAYLHSDGTFNKTKKVGEQNGLAIGIFASSQNSENELVILEIK